MIHPSGDLPGSSPRRWLQFRLRSLLLVPLLMGLFFTFSDQPFDHFALLMLGYGGVFGSLMQSIGPHCRGLRRVATVAWAAVLGGLTSGLLAGGPALLIALERGPTTKVLPWDVFDLREWRAMSFDLASAWLGGVLGAAGGTLLGVAIAYLSHLHLRHVSKDLPFSLPPGPTSGVPASRGARVGRWVLVCVYALPLLIPPAWWLYRLGGRRADEWAIANLQATGVQVHLTGNIDAPTWLRSLLAASRSEDVFYRVYTISVVGPVDAQGWQCIADLDDLHLLSLTQPGMDDGQLHDLAASLRDCRFPRVSLSLHGSQITDAGLTSLSGMPRLISLDLGKSQVSDSGLIHLYTVPQLETLLLTDTNVTPRGVKALRTAAPRLRVLPPERKKLLHIPTKPDAAGR